MSALLNEQLRKREKSKKDILIRVLANEQSIKTVCENEQPVMRFSEKSIPVSVRFEKFILLRLEFFPSAAVRSPHDSFLVILNIQPL